MSNVTAFPYYQIHNVPEALRLLAQKIESGQIEAKRVVVVLEDNESAIDYRAFGEDFTRAHAVGVLDVAKQLVMFHAVRYSQEKIDNE